MTTQTVNIHGIDVTVKKVKRGYKVLVESILDGLDETRSTFNAFRREELLLDTKWLSTKDTISFIMYCAETNSKAKDVAQANSIAGMKARPDLVAEGMAIIQDALEETGDNIVGEGWFHPLSEFEVFNGVETVNFYGVASLGIVQIYKGNEQCKLNFQKLLLAHNPLTNLNAFDELVSVPLESSWLRATSMIVEALEAQVEIS